MSMAADADARCDKCGNAVAPRNNALIYQAEAGEMPWHLATVAQPRHLAPDGACQGSPSRFQHITGRPDGRGFPGPTPESIAAWRKACCKINGDACPGWCGRDATELA